MTPFLQAGNPSWITWTHIWASMALLHLYIGVGVWWAFRIRRARDARLGRSAASRGEAATSRRSMAQWLDDLYGLSALRSRAAQALGTLRVRPSTGRRREPAKDERAPIA
jgi:hypothetical protein